MSDGCRCEYLSEECGGADVVCQHCHDAAKSKINILRAALEDIKKLGHGYEHGCGYTCANIAMRALNASGRPVAMSNGGAQ